MPYIKTHSGTTLYYKDWGVGKTVVFIHAWGMNSTFWEYTMLALNAKGFRCISYDRRGHGKSDDPGTGYDLDTLTGDLNDLLEQLDLYDVILIGHSMGGCEVIRYQVVYGEERRVSKIVLLAAPDYLLKAEDNPEGVEVEQLNEVLAALAQDFPKWLKENADPFYLPAEFDVSNEMIRWTIDMMLSTSMRALLDCQRMVFFTDMRGDIGRITIPTLVVHGDKDASIPIRCGEAIAATIPGCLFKTYKGAPHGLIITHAQQLNDDLASFINTDEHS